MVSRQVAKKVRIRDLVEGSYVRMPGEWEPNYVQTSDGRTFSRVNLISVVATEPVKDTSYQTFVVDDGSGRVPVRCFDEKPPEVSLGDMILLIGRIREFSQQIYIVPEIVKKIRNKAWVELRQLELGEPKPAEKVVVEAAEERTNPVEELLQAIRDLDAGDGVDIDAVAKTKDSEKLLDSLLKEGEIFEVRPGRIKVLE